MRANALSELQALPPRNVRVVLRACAIQGFLARFACEPLSFFKRFRFSATACLPRHPD